MTETATRAARSATGGTDLDELCINTVRTLSMDAVQQANSGHPGTPMALAPLAYLLFTKHLRYDAAHPDWPNRDRFVLSCGHASMLLYSVLYLTGYDVTLEDIKHFRQWGSKTPGHPEYGHTPGVETTTGPLGQGFANAVGMALAEYHLAAEFNTPDDVVIDHRTYVFASDGDLMEGISHEAASIAGHLGLGKLIVCYDDNSITLDGPASLSMSDDTGTRFEAYGWNVIRVPDVNDLPVMDRALAQARDVHDRPTLIIVRSHIGYGSPHKQDTSAAHGEALGVDEVKLTKQNLGWQWTDTFHVPPDALAAWREAGKRGASVRTDWERRRDAWANRRHESARELDRRLARTLPDGWRSALPTFQPNEKGMATRMASNVVINALGPKIPELVGGAADLSTSTKTIISASDRLERDTPRGRNLFYGVREHAMAAILNGMYVHGGIIPFGATFLIFSDYMRPPTRLAALMKIRPIYVFTHDSVGLGEDGPTHQPIEQLAALRAIPNFTLFRPADAAETAEAWAAALEHTTGPVALALTRQNVPILDRTRYAPASGVARGAYVLSDAEGGAADVILLGSGSEVHILLTAQEQLLGTGIRARVVSVPSIERFYAQPVSYRDQVLPRTMHHRIAMEAASPQPWYRLVGDSGVVIGLERFGASAPYERIYRELGLTAEHVVSAARAMLNR
ncbi:MAG TPA: transketolase [Gemmatimonadaceae bacterium]|nr:transketolase [Gemmatimonadaceae bacterium]